MMFHSKFARENLRDQVFKRRGVIKEHGLLLNNLLNEFIETGNHCGEDNSVCFFIDEIVQYSLLVTDNKIDDHFSDRDIQKLVHDILKNQKNPESAAQYLFDLLDNEIMKKYYAEYESYRNEMYQYHSHKYLVIDAKTKKPKYNFDGSLVYHEEEYKYQYQISETTKELANDVINRFKAAILIEHDFNIKQKMMPPKRGDSAEEKQVNKLASSFKTLKTYGIKHHDSDIKAFIDMAAKKMINDPESAREFLGNKLKERIKQHGLTKKGQLLIALRDDFLSRPDGNIVKVDENALKLVPKASTVLFEKLREEVLLLKIALGRYLDSHTITSPWHSRQSHVRSILDSLNKSGDKTIRDKPIRDKTEYIAFLYVHYSAIKSKNSTLSKMLEDALITILELKLAKDCDFFIEITRAITNPGLFDAVFNAKNARLASRLLDLDKRETSHKMWFLSSHSAEVEKEYTELTKDKNNLSGSFS
jgi:hypothetical protein